MPKDLITPDLFSERAPLTSGSLACSVEVAHTMAEAIKNCAHDRAQIVERMSRYLGRAVTLPVINAYTSEARREHNISLERAIAFDHATESFALLELHARKCGAKVLSGTDVLLYELGRVEQSKRDLSERERALRLAARVLLNGKS